MPAKKTITELDRRKVLYFHYLNGIDTPQKLHDITNIPLRTCRRNLKNFRKGKGPERKVRIYHSASLSPNDRRRLSQLAICNPKWSADQLVAEMVKRGSPKVSNRTIQRTLIAAGIRKWTPEKMPPLTETHKRNRVKWCREHLNQDWSVVFTDESYVELFRSKIQLWARSKPFAKSYAKPPKIMIWGGISLRGKTPLKVDCGTVNSDHYQDIIHECLMESMSIVYPEGYVLQQDNASCHKSKSTMQWFEKQGITVLKWPAMSPDLNPIENLWSVIKRRLEKLDPTKIEDMKYGIEKIWEDIDEEILESLIGSMKKRLELCIAAEGEKIKY